MTRFDIDMNQAMNGNEIEVLTRRKAEIDRLKAESRTCKNGFRRQCIAQELERLNAEYDKIDSQF